MRSGEENTSGQTEESKEAMHIRAMRTQSCRMTASRSRGMNEWDQRTSNGLEISPTELQGSTLASATNSQLHDSHAHDAKTRARNKLDHRAQSTG